jgi:hypothetical protein
MLAVLAACAALAAASVPMPGTLLSSAHAQEAKTKAKGSEGGRSVELRRGGYYSYGAEGGVPKSNLHLAPMVGLQSPAGPFDSGFFFDSGLYPHYWNNTPYPN